MKARNSIYVITDRRAISFEGGLTLRNMKITSFLLNQLQNIYRNERQDGMGDIILFRSVLNNNTNDPHYNHHNYNERPVRMEDGFLNIRNTREVHRLLLSLSQQHYTAAPTYHTSMSPQFSSSYINPSSAGSAVTSINTSSSDAYPPPDEPPAATATAIYSPIHVIAVDTPTVYGKMTPT
jgi:hypothetical protein